MKPACWLVCPSSIKFLAVLCPQTAATGRTPSTSACANFIRCSRQFSWWHMRPLLQGVRRKCASGWWKSCKWSCEGSWSIKWITLGLKKMMVCLQNEKIFPHHFDLKLCLAFHLISWLFFTSFLYTSCASPRNAHPSPASMRPHLDSLVSEGGWSSSRALAFQSFFVHVGLQTLTKSAFWRRKKSWTCLQQMQKWGISLSRVTPWNTCD